MNNIGLSNSERNKKIYKAGLVGILLNLVLFIIKFFAGSLSKSISITADAFNNLTDMGSAIITIIGTKFASKPADEEHPFGHGRMEYIASFIVSLIVLNLALEFFKNSLKKIIRPQVVSTSKLTLAILIISILIKVFLTIYNRKLAKDLHSSSLKAVAADAMGDVIITAVILIAMIFVKFTTLPVDGILGLILSLIIAYAGYELARDTISSLLGEAPEEDFIKKLSNDLEDQPGIHRVHDLIVHNYGLRNTIASVHAEVNADDDIVKVHNYIDQAEKYILETWGIHIVIHMDPVYYSDGRVIEENMQERGILIAGSDKSK